MDRVGLPFWLIAAVTGLLHMVTVRPLLPDGLGGPIQIHRGVKQGCPLSPLLFVLCYDVLLTFLAEHPDHEDYAFADDLAVGVDDIPKLVPLLTEISAFSSFSGLGLNMDKTCLLSAQRVFYSDQVVLSEAGYGAIQFVDRGLYLGVLLGQAVTQR